MMNTTAAGKFVHLFLFASCFSPSILALTNSAFYRLRLSVLNLRFSTNLTNASLQLVTEECPHLKALDLGFCALITDEGLGHLPSLSELNNLDLTECKKVTDKGYNKKGRVFGGGVFCCYETVRSAHAVLFPF